MELDDVEEDVQRVANSDDLRVAIQVLRDEKLIVVHATGNLERSGSINVLIVSTIDKRIFMFDISNLGDEVFDAGMREILEWQRWVKVLYDCKRASDTLYHVYGVKLSNLMDVQLLEVMKFEQFIAPGETAGSTAQTKFVKSLKMSGEK